MRRRAAALSAVLLVSALFLFSNLEIAGRLAGNLGVIGSEAVSQKTSLVTIRPQNYSYLESNLAPGDTLTLSLAANPGNVDVLLMNQGNFSLWTSGGRVSYSTYPQSALHKSNYSLVFTNEEATQNFFIVLVSHALDGSTEVLVREAVTRPSQLVSFVLPLSLGVVGAIMIVYALKGGRHAGGDSSIERAPLSTSKADSKRGSTPTSRCRYCGSSLVPLSSFCPACNKSQG